MDLSSINGRLAELQRERIFFVIQSFKEISGMVQEATIPKQDRVFLMGEIESMKNKCVKSCRRGVVQFFQAAERIEELKIKIRELL